VTDLSQELAIAIAAAQDAAQFALQEYQSFEAIPNAPATISTHVDHACQEIILQKILSAFPDDALLGEEKTPTLDRAIRQGHRLWVVDPIDGTRGFAQKNGEFSIMVGFAIHGKAVVGVVAEPVLGRLTYASTGGGCWRVDGNAPPVRCQVRPTVTLQDAILTQSHSRPGRSSFARRLLEPGYVRETYSAGIKLALVARGEVDLYVNDYTNFNDWDICAGHILVEEAGGQVREFGGDTILYGVGQGGRRGLAATNHGLYPEVMRRIHETLT
jgi:3'(2'), 5'-bisphosphate nucleotidase